MHINSAEVRPGSEVDITFNAQPNSYIGLMAVDQNIINSRSSHDITHSQIVRELINYDAAEMSPYFGVFNANGNFPWSPGNSNAKETFKVIYFEKLITNIL